MHDLFVVGIPVLVILVGLVFSRNDIKDLRGDMKDLRGDMKDLRGEMKDIRGEMRDVRLEMAARHTEVMSRFNVLEADMRQFYHLTGKLEARVDALEKR